MSSRAKGYRSRKRSRSYGQSNQERRVKTFEVYRPVARTDAERIHAVFDLFFHGEERMDDVPQLSRINHKLRLRILDPQLVKQRFSKGFEAGYNYRDAIEKIKDNHNGKESYELPIAGVSVGGYEGRRRYIGLVFRDTRLQQEQRAVRQSLAEVGIRGFKGKGSRVEPETSLTVAHAQIHIPSEREINKILERGRQPEPFPMAAEELAEHLEVSLQEAGVTSLAVDPVRVHATTPH